MADGGASITDVVAVGVGIVGVVSTLVLTLIGTYLAWRFSESTKKIEELEATVGNDRENLYGARVLSEVMMESFSNVQSLLELQRRVIEDLVSAPPHDKVAYLRNFKTRSEGKINELVRITFYFNVMNSPDYCEEDIAALVLHYPDTRSHYFLCGLAKLIGGKDGEAIQEEADRLDAHLRRRYVKAAF
jgi:hypothetical protein